MKFMRAHGDNNPNGQNPPGGKTDDETCLDGEGAWWAYWIETPY
jgi:hypothetical protein